jgi:hypothetical protein
LFTFKRGLLQFGNLTITDPSTRCFFAALLKGCWRALRFWPELLDSSDSADELRAR